MELNKVKKINYQTNSNDVFHCFFCIIVPKVFNKKNLN